LRNLQLEARVAERPAAVRCGTQVLDEILVERGAKQRAILLLSRGRRTPKPAIAFERRASFAPDGAHPTRSGLL
jgi:hypothetical protein